MLARRTNTAREVLLSSARPVTSQLKKSRSLRRSLLLRRCGALVDRPVRATEFEICRRCGQANRNQVCVME